MVEAVSRLGAQVAAGASVPEKRFLAAVSADARPELAELVRRIGTPEAFGLLDQDPDMLLAGDGLLQLGNRQLRPERFIEGLILHRSALARIYRIVIPRKGLRIVARRSTFHALRLERVRWDPRTIVYVDRYVDAAARKFVERAVLLKAPVEVRADISFSGVLFARSIAAIAKRLFRAPRMSPRYLEWAPQRFPISDEELAAIDENLRAEPEALLAQTLRTVRGQGTWAQSW